MAAQRGWPRLLLLVAVTLGVAGMHTLGHPDAGHSTAAPAPTHDTAATPDHQIAAASARMAETVVLTPATGTGMGLDPMTMCLAIISFAGLLLLAILALSADRRAFPARHIAPLHAAAVGRGPPQRLGLHLADLSVLRI